MRPHRPKDIMTLMRTWIISIIGISAVLGLGISMTYDLVRDYKTKVHNIEQIGKLLASSASSPEGVDLVADQVSELLNNDPTIQSIIFYSIDHPIVRDKQAEADWRCALFAETTSINQAVTSRYFISRDMTAEATPSDSLAKSAQVIEDNTLLGYISITLDVEELRAQWLREYRFIWLLALILAPLSAYFILRVLTRPVRQFVRLAQISEEVTHNPELTQLPIIQQDRELPEVSSIEGAMISLFKRLAEMKKEHESLKAYEQQLYSKDLSLDVQRHSFQSMITHELRTSLNAIFGGLQLLNNHYLSSEQQDALTIIRKGSQHLDFTLEQIIQLNKIEKGQIGLTPVEFDPLQLLSDLMVEFEPRARQKDLVLTSRITHIGYKLEGDISKIRLILTTLIDNAIKFTKSGTVTIESHLNHFDKNTRWQVSVIDTGIGIDQHYVDDIFTPFFQIDPSINREFEGVGVGLSVAKQMAHLIGAALDVESRAGQGSKFRVTMQLDNWQEHHNRNLLNGINALYYHQVDYQEQSYTLPNQLTNFGLTPKSIQHQRLLIESLRNHEFDLLLIAEDIVPKKAIQIAQEVRSIESTNRIFIVYLVHADEKWQDFDADFKAAGIDSYIEATTSVEAIAAELKQWLMI